MIYVVRDNILNTKVDAIVNPANVSLLAGSGLCGVIHKHAGPELETDCKILGQQEYGNAVITKAYSLPNCEHIIHACGPRWLDGARGEDELLTLTYQNIVNVALENKLSSIAIPAISTGIYKFPIKEATRIAVTIINNQCNVASLDILFVIKELDKYLVYKNFLEKYKC